MSAHIVIEIGEQTLVSDGVKLTLEAASLWTCVVQHTGCLVCVRVARECIREAQRSIVDAFESDGTHYVLVTRVTNGSTLAEVAGLPETSTTSDRSVSAEAAEIASKPRTKYTATGARARVESFDMSALVSESVTRGELRARRSRKTGGKS